MVDFQNMQSKRLTPAESDVYKAKVKALGASLAVAYMYDGPHIHLTCDDEKRAALMALRDCIFEYWRLIDPSLKDESKCKGVLWELTREYQGNPFGALKKENIPWLWDRWQWCIDTLLHPEKLKK